MVNIRLNNKQVLEDPCKCIQVCAISIHKQREDMIHNMKGKPILIQNKRGDQTTVLFEDVSGSKLKIRDSNGQLVVMPLSFFVKVV